MFRQFQNLSINKKEGTSMHKHYQGIYAPYIKQLIDLKRGLGFKYFTEETIFFIFDRFTVQREESIVGVTRDLANAWYKLRPNESDSYKYHRCTCLNQLASFLSDIGIRSYVAPLPVNKSTFNPYIFSKTEIANVFDFCDATANNKKRMDSGIICFPTLIRLLYATGLRISEALALRNTDVNLTDKYLVVKVGKNGKERLIPISESLSEVCNEYVCYRDLMPLGKLKSDYFFITLSGRACKTDYVRKRFKKLLWNAGISRNDQGPRLHDLRHTFSVHSLAMMAESGLDLYCSLPILSTYLGHQSLHATNSYVRLTSDMYPNLLKEVDSIYLNVFPKI